MLNLKKPEIVDIEVIVDLPENQAYPCNVSFGFPEKKNGKVKHWKENDKYHVSFENQGADGFIVLFNIENDNGTGCRFILDPDEAMWVHNKQQCPTSTVHWPQFKAVSVINGGRTLVVYNMNGWEEKFAFTLRFTIPGCGTLDFDPIGDNMNGQ